MEYIFGHINPLLRSRTFKYIIALQDVKEVNEKLIFGKPPEQFISVISGKNPSNPCKNYHSKKELGSDDTFYFLKEFSLFQKHLQHENCAKDSHLL